MDLSVNIKASVDELIAGVKRAMGAVTELGNSASTPHKVNIDTKEAEQNIKKLASEAKAAGESAARGASGLSAMFGGLVAGGGLALAQVGLSAVTGAISGVVDAALEADEIGDKMELAFRQAGLSGKELDEQLDSTTKFARKLGDQFAESPAEIKKLSTAAASLGGATGKANEDMTKLALGIAKASDGAISGEGAIKILSKGVADPENAAALDKLTKKFPALGDALNGAGDTAGKVNASLLALAPTFATLEAQSTGIDAIAARFQNAGAEALQSLGGGVIAGLDKAGAAIAKAAGGLNFEGLYETAANIGEAIGGAVSTAVVYILDFYEKVKPIISFIADILIAQVRIQFGYFQAIISGAFEIVGQIFDSLREAVQPLIDTLSELFASTGEGTDYVQEFIDTIKEVVQVVVGVGKVLIEFLVTPIKILVTEIVAIIGWISKLVSGFKSTSDGANEAAGGVEKAKTGFEKFRDILQNIQLFLSGVAGAIKGVSNDVVNLVKALGSFNLSKIKDAFLNLGGGAKQGFEEGWNQKKADLESDSVVKQFEKQIEDLDDKSKELSAAQLAEQKKLLADKVAAQKAANKISLDQETDLQAEIAKLGQSATKDKDLSKDPKGKVEKERDLTEAIKKAKLDNEKILSDIETKGIEDAKERELKAVTERTANSLQAVKDEADKVKALKNVSGKQKEELIKILNDREKILVEQSELDKEAIRDKYAKKELEAITKHAEEVQKRNAEVDKINAEQDLKDAEIAEQRRLLNITDEVERERQIRLAGVQKTLDAELAASLGVERAKNEAYAKAALERDQIARDSARRQSGVFGEIVDGFRDFASSLSSTVTAAFKKSADEQEEAKKKLTDNKDSYEKDTSELKDQLKARVVSWADYQDKIAALNKKFQDAIAANGASFGKIFKDGILSALQNTADGFKKNADSIVAAWDKAGQKIADIDNAIRDRQSKLTAATAEERATLNREIEGLNQERNKSEKDSSSLTTQLYANMAVSLGTSFASSIADGKKNIGEYTIMALDALESLIPIFSAQILAGSLATPASILSGGAAGIAQWAGLTLLITGAVEAAKAGVRSGFHDGGYTGDGNEYDVAGVVHRKEGVLSHAALRGDVSAFHDLHNTLKSGESLSNILARYRREGESNSLVTPLGAVITNSPATAFVATNNDARLIAELRAQTAQLSQQLTEIKIGQKSAFKSNHNIGLDIAPSKFFDVIQTPRDIKRRSLQ